MIAQNVVVKKQLVPRFRANAVSEEVPEAIREFIKEYDAILLSRHGAMTVGPEVMDAYNKMEKLEHTARVVLAARLQGSLLPLPPAEVEKLRRLGAKYRAGGVRFEV